MGLNFYVMHNPFTFNLMDLQGKIHNINDLLIHLTGKTNDSLSEENYLDFLRFDLGKGRKGMIESFGIDSYASNYIANQIAQIKPNSKVILSDNGRKGLDEIIRENGKPSAVFITSMSSNFPTTVVTTIALNYAKIPTVIGGIHVSAKGEDVRRFILENSPHPELITYVEGPGDSKIVETILDDLHNGELRSKYIGTKTIEDGVWGHSNVIPMKPMDFSKVSRVPLVGWLGKYFTLNLSTPYSGCPYSCSFCSISSLKKEQRKFQKRTPQDFISELENIQSKNQGLRERVHFFLPDNLLVGGDKLEQILDLMIVSDLKINYLAQISIDVANNERLLEKLRASGASHFFVGLESLNFKNLKSIGKNVVNEITSKRLTVQEFYKQQIKKIQKHGISIHAGFMFGLPFDYFNNLEDHSGIEIANFCKETHIGAQTTVITDLPGSKDFNESQRLKRTLYGENNPLDYLISLCTCDVREGNRIISSDLLHNSPLVAAYMAYDTARRTGSSITSLKNGIYMAHKAFSSPTQKGQESLKERLFDSFISLACQITTAMEKENHEEVAYSTSKYKGSFERLYGLETNPHIKKMFKEYIKQFQHI
ncbi:MAG: radical SAM protein [Nanoarchaeota archaeon]|nr:radical SAM protein [Nanoarchaeota archaeon]